MREGKRAPEESYILSLESGGGDKASNASEATFHKYENESHPDAGEPVASKKSRISLEDPRHTSPQNAIKSQAYESLNATSGSDNSLHSPGSEVNSSMTFEGQTKNVMSIFISHEMVSVSLFAKMRLGFCSSHTGEESCIVMRISLFLLIRLQHQTQNCFIVLLI